jgi:hypothetical protein
MLKVIVIITYIRKKKETVHIMQQKETLFRFISLLVNPAQQ